LQEKLNNIKDEYISIISQDNTWEYFPFIDELKKDIFIKALMVSVYKWRYWPIIEFLGDLASTGDNISSWMIDKELYDKYSLYLEGEYKDCISYVNLKVIEIISKSS